MRLKLKLRNKKAKCICILLLCLFGLSLIPLHAFAQQSNKIHGTITDQAGNPVIGASVSIKGSTKGILTDENGQYAIDASASDYLLFSFIGMQPQSLLVGNKKTMNVHLRDTAKSFDEVVVVGYGTQRKKDLTTAVSSVNSKEWADRPIISAQQALQGKAAGVQVMQPSGKPGVGLTVRVRGTTSLNAGNEPLYVVDGIPTDDITNLAPSDIESMQILKDASSAAIYGARAANGVVLISTKQGKTGKARVSVDMYVGFSNVSKQIKTLNTPEYYDLMKEIGVSVDPTNQNYTDWGKQMYGTGIQQNYQASVSGGTDKTKYYVSGGYQKESGVISPADYSRYSFRSNINSKATSWLKVSTNLSFSNNNRIDALDNANVDRGGVVMSILNTPPFLSIWDPKNPGQYAPNPYQPSWENPFAQANTYDDTQAKRFMGNVSLEFTILPGLTFKPSLSVDYINQQWDKFIDPVKTQLGRQSNGKGENKHDDYMTWLNENILSYSKTFNDKHHLNVMAGLTLQQTRHNNSYISVEDFVKGTTYKVMTLNMANKIDDASTSRDGYSLMSYLARVQYDYMSRYLFTANFRSDGSSKLYHRWDYFPSFSAGWRFSDEKFFKPLKKVVDDAKIRAGWGINGNQNGIGDYDFYDKYVISRQDKVGEGPAVKPGKLGNRDLRWETTTQYDLGLDLSLFKGRLTGEFDWYYKKTDNLLLDIKLPTSAGVSLPLRNDGQMINKGFEFNLNGRILTGDFKWDAGLNMSFNRNRLTKLGLTPQFTATTIESNGDDVIMVRKGLPLGSFYGYVAHGVDPQTGNVIYEDLNHNGIAGVSKDGAPDPGDKTIIGNAQPDFIFGFTHNFAWKHFSLNLFFQGSYGNDIFNASRIDSEGMFNSKNQRTSVLRRWEHVGMETDIPRAGDINNSLNSTRFVEDGSYIRLKSLTLAYSFSQKLLRPLHIQKLSVYGTANNLFTLTKYSGYDPELNSGGTTAAQLGIDFGTYPQTRSFIFGLNVTF